MPKLTTEERYRRELKLLATEAKAWESIHARAQFGVEFLIDGRHYKDSQEGHASTDSDEIRWVGEESFNRWRHEIGAATEPGSLTARPVDTYGDPDLADVAVKLVQSETENPAKEFEDAWYDVVGTGSAAGYGVAWLDYLPDEGPWGELILAADDPRNFMMDRRVKSVHSPRCRFVARKMRMTIAEVKRRCQGKGGWKMPKGAKLIPDDGQNADLLGRLASQQGEETTTGVRLRSDAPDGTGQDDDGKEVTIYVIWRRHTDDVEEEKDYTEFEPGDRYMRCTSCGYRTEAQNMLPPNEDGSEQELPESLDNGCPECMQSTDVALHGNMVRVDGSERTIEMLAYPRGYLCVLAPYALPGVEQFLYEGPWPWKLRSYPCTFLPRFRHPFKVAGPSLADLAAWNQIATDMMVRLVLERMVSSEPQPLLPRDRITDARNMPWEMSTERNNGAYYDGDSMPATGMIGGDPGIPAAWSQVYQACKNSLTGSQGIADFSIAESQSRDIPASSVALQVRQEEIPVADYKRRYQRQRGLLIGVYYDFMRAVYPAERLYRLLGPDAADAVRALAASDLPNFDFHFDSSPDLQPQDEAGAKATDLLIATIEQRPWAVDLVAQRNKISPALVRKARQDYQKWQMEQQQAAQAAAAASPGAQPGMSPSSPAAPQESPAAMVQRLLASTGPQQ